MSVLCHHHKTKQSPDISFFLDLGPNEIKKNVTINSVNWFEKMTCLFEDRSAFKFFVCLLYCRNWQIFSSMLVFWRIFCSSSSSCVVSAGLCWKFTRGKSADAGTGGVLVGPSADSCAPPSSFRVLFCVSLCVRGDVRRFFKKTFFFSTEQDKKTKPSLFTNLILHRGR